MYQIEVENIKCGGCANSIEKELLKLEKVDKVTVNIDTNSIVIVGDADRRLVIEKLAALGYPEKRNNTVFCKAKSYLSCAIGKMN